MFVIPLRWILPSQQQDVHSSGDVHHRDSFLLACTCSLSPTITASCLGGSAIWPVPEWIEWSRWSADGEAEGANRDADKAVFAACMPVPVLCGMRPCQGMSQKKKCSLRWRFHWWRQPFLRANFHHTVPTLLEVKFSFLHCISWQLLTNKKQKI